MPKFAYFRSTNKVVQTPVMVGDDEALIKACQCSHPHWVSQSPINPATGWIGEMQRCADCVAVRMVFSSEALSHVGPVMTEEEYEREVRIGQRVSLEIMQEKMREKV